MVVPDVAEALRIRVRDLNISISTSDQMILHEFQGKLDREGDAVGPSKVWNFPAATIRGPCPERLLELSGRL